MSDVDAMVEQQSERFQAELPVLLRGPGAGRWALYRDGVHDYFDSERDAYVAGLKRFGAGGGFVVAKVEHEEPHFMTAAFAYSVAR